MSVLLLVLALLAGAAWLVFLSSVLAVERVRVSGADTVPTSRVTTVARVPLGEPLARVDVDRVRTRVESILAVERADIGRSWPHTLTIEVTERTPVGVVDTGLAYRLVDDDGVLYRTVTGPRPRGGELPLMTVGPRPRAVREAAAVVAALPDRLARRVSAVDADTMDSIELRLRDGRTVVWGSAESSALKARVLAALLPRKAAVYDVSVPGAPTLQPR